MATQPTGNLKDSSLQQLIDECQSQIKLFKAQSQAKSAKKLQKEESPSCLEIVRRAANKDDAALAALFEITADYISRKCQEYPAYLREDIGQEVYIRLLPKLRGEFRVSSFGEYVNYVYLTIRSVYLNMARKKDNTTNSLDVMVEAGTLKIHRPSDVDIVERRNLVDIVIQLLSDPLEVECIVRRNGYGESPDEIVEALLERYPDITKARVYRIVQEAFRKLRNHPRFMGLLADWLAP